MSELKVINPIDKLEYIITANKTGENQMVCPVCSHTRQKKSLKCFSFNLQKGAGKCQHCGVVLVEPKEIPLKRTEVQFKQPKWKNCTELSEKVVKWFEGRKISQRVLKEFNITEGKEWMPQTEKEENTIQFNYFRLGEIVNIKYRDAKKNFKLFKGAEKILYNIDILETSIIIKSMRHEIIIFICFF